jgi:hypothetical protein
MSRIDQQQSGVARSFRHLGGNGAAMFVVAHLALAVWPAPCYADSKIPRAKMDIKSIEAAIVGYKWHNGEWPVNLKILTEIQPVGGFGFLDVSVLKDPWGQPYHYDTNHQNPATGIPHIWSEGPSSEAWLSNWEQNPYWEKAKYYENLWNSLSISLLLVSVSLVVGAVVWLTSRSQTLFQNPQTTGFRALIAKLGLVTLIAAAALFFAFLFDLLFVPKFLS